MVQRQGVPCLGTTKTGPSGHVPGRTKKRLLAVFGAISVLLRVRYVWAVGVRADVVRGYEKRVDKLEITVIRFYI